MQTRLLLLVMKPSSLSASATATLAISALVATNWPYFTYNPALYSALYGEYGLVTALEHAPSFAIDIAANLGDNQLVFAVTIGLIAALAGWVAFMVVHAVHSGVLTAGALEGSDERISTLEHIAVRFFIVLMWFLFGFITVGSLMPLALLMSRIGAEEIFTIRGVALNVGALALLMLVFHLHVVFLRLFLLRPRVFGGESEIESVAFPTHTDQI